MTAWTQSVSSWPPFHGTRTFWFLGACSFSRTSRATAVDGSNLRQRRATGGRVRRVRLVL